MRYVDVMRCIIIKIVIIMLSMSCCGEIENNFMMFDCYFYIHHRCNFVNKILLNGVKKCCYYSFFYCIDCSDLGILCQKQRIF